MLIAFSALSDSVLNIYPFSYSPSFQDNNAGIKVCLITNKENKIPYLEQLKSQILWAESVLDCGMESIMSLVSLCQYVDQPNYLRIFWFSGIYSCDFPFVWDS